MCRGGRTPMPPSTSPLNAGRRPSSSPPRATGWRVARLLGYCALALAPLAPATLAADTRPALRIPRVQRPVTLEDFAGMRPSGEIARELVKAAEFTQYTPDAGNAPTQRTEVYLGYDQANLYVAFLAF